MCYHEFMQLMGKTSDGECFGDCRGLFFLRMGALLFPGGHLANRPIGQVIFPEPSSAQSEKIIQVFSFPYIGHTEDETGRPNKIDRPERRIREIQRP